MIKKMPETYTLWWKNQAKHLRYMKYYSKDGRCEFELDECQELAKKLLELFNKVQFKNSEVDEK